MTLDYPYWYLTIRNITPIQWRDHDGREISEIALSNLHFDDQAEPYLTGKFLNGGTAYYNLGLKISELIDSMSEQYFLNTLSNIGTLEFSMSRQWSDRFGTKSFRDLLSRIEFYSNAGFTILGAQVTLYLGNGTVPGYALSSGGFYWEKIGAGESVLWEPSRAYNVFDSYTRKFSGFISGKKTSKNEISFSCESRLSLLDVMIGKPVPEGRNSSSEIEPICFGTTNRLPTTDKDDSFGFPLAQFNGSKSTSFNACAFDVIEIRNIVTFDSVSNAPYISVDPIKHRVSNSSEIFLAESYSQSMAVERLESGKWQATEFEQDALLSSSYLDASTQTIFTDDGESVAIHSRTPYGFSFPDGSTPLVPYSTFEESGSLDSRAWNDTKRVGHNAGTIYQVNSGEAAGSKHRFIITLPIADLVQLPVDTTGALNQHVGMFNTNVAINGDVKRLGIASADGAIDDNGTLKIGLTRYGPAVINIPAGGVVVTELNPFNVLGKIRFVWRTLKPDIDDDGTDDGTKSTGSDHLSKMAITYDFHMGAGASSSMDSACLLRFGRAPKKSFSTEMEGAQSVSYVTDNGFNVLLSGGPAGIYTNTIVREIPMPIAPFDYYGEQIDGMSFSSLWDSNRMWIDVDMKSDYVENGVYPSTTLSFNHAFVYLQRLLIAYHVDLSLSDRKLYWIGQGIKRTDSALVANDGSNICTAIMKHFTGIDIGTEDAEINLCGAISERVNLRDAMRSIASQSFSLLYEKDGGVYMRRLNGQYDRPFVITDSMFLVDDAGWIEVEGSETDISALYSSVEVMFRPDTQDRYMGCITIGAGYNKVWNEPSESVINYDFTDPVKWLHISSAEMNELSNICYSAEKIRGTVGSEKANKLSIKAPYIRTRADAEKYLADLVKYACVQLKKIAMSVTIEASKDIDVGDTISFNLPPEHRDGYMYQSNLSTSRRFIVVKKSMMLDSEVAMCKINLVEIPYNSVLGYP